MRGCFIYQPNPALVFSKKEGIFYIQNELYILKFYAVHLVRQFIDQSRFKKNKWYFNV